MRVLIITAVALVALLALYIFVVRPLLEKMGVVRPIPSGLTHTMGRVYSFFRFSLTMVVGWITTLGGFVLWLPQLLGDLFSDPDMKANVAAMFADWPKFIAGMFVVVGVFTMLARMRTAPRVTEMRRSTRWGG